ncbi:hypothetical protein [Chitinophaga sp. Ak27]|uniref:hypothetical protein n=1 Tax=Chitinophaga sp. Ak27 TaxID=2726116 RepID=UPI00145DB753|nr:hypothetical protein [Chitinophaga sp. Ak27]NLU90322.1 hypothetical protein [Chitinophaga sp. Ak27]
MPDKSTAALEVALSIADEIFDNKRDVIEVTTKIERIAIGHLNGCTGHDNASVLTSGSIYSRRKAAILEMQNFSPQALRKEDDYLNFKRKQKE